MGALAEVMRDAQAIGDVPKDVLQQIRACSRCNACTVDCPAGLDTSEIVMYARARLLDLDPQLVSDYRAWNIAYRHNLFYDLRKVMDARFDDVLVADPAFDSPGDIGKAGLSGDALGADSVWSASDGYETLNDARKDLEGNSRVDSASQLFMPGCSLASFAPALAKKVYGYLHDNGLADAIMLYCCGNLLGNSGQINEYVKYTHSFVDMLRKCCVQRIIVACPNCYKSLNATFKREGVQGIELQTLPQALDINGMRFDPVDTASGAVIDAVGNAGGGYGGVTSDMAAGISHASTLTYTMHDSCPDRVYGRFASPLRRIFSDMDTVEMEHAKHDTICCGSGGLASAYGMEIPMYRCDRRLNECAAAGADCMVTSCAACANVFASVIGAGGAANGDADRATGGATDGASDMTAGEADAACKMPWTRHYLELLFDEQIDWAALRAALDKIWATPERYLLMPIEQDEKVF
jgi:Fe-S oxidoreductase